MQKFAALSIATILLSGAAIAQEMKSIPADTPLKWVDSTALPRARVSYWWAIPRRQRSWCCAPSSRQTTSHRHIRIPSPRPSP